MRFGLALIAAVGLSACAERDIALNASYVTDFGSFQDNDYVGDRADSTAEKAGMAQWNDAREVTLTLRQNEFSPMIVHLKKGVPYVVTVKNNDLDAVSFSAQEFFANASVSHLSEATHEEEVFAAAEKPVLVSFVVPPKGERQIKVVPVMEGRYEFEDGAPGIFFNQWHLSPWSNGATMGTSGVFIVD